jgi:hypothetical protein
LIEQVWTENGHGEWEDKGEQKQLELAKHVEFQGAVENFGHRQENPREESQEELDE